MMNQTKKKDKRKHESQFQAQAICILLVWDKGLALIFSAHELEHKHKEIYIFYFATSPLIHKKEYN